MKVLYPGRRSVSGGPDFQGALLEIEGQLRRGDVELHLRSSLWHQHGHDRDPAYSQVILHVVLVDDMPAGRGPGRETLCLGPFLAETPDGMWVARGAFLSGNCCHAGRRLEDLEPVVLQLARRRFERKVALFEANASAVGRDQALWEGCLGVLGHPANRGAFGVLARSVPWRWVAAEIDCPERVEAMVMGAAGWLDRAGQGARDLWPDVSTFWDLSSLPAKLWRCTGFRPSAAPWLRLLGIVRLLAHERGWRLLSRIGAIVADRGSRGALEVTKPLTGGPDPRLGLGCAVELLANVLLPALATEGDGMEAAAWSVWCSLPCPGYGVTRGMERAFGLERAPRKVYWAQGLLELRARYCAEARQELCPLQGRAFLD